MSPTSSPTRMTIDFRDAVRPSRLWIVGVGETSGDRVDLLGSARPVASSLGASASRPTPFAHPAAIAADCACPEFCERDHANE